MDQGHLLMPKMYALLYWSTPLTLSPAPHYPLWNETFIIPWCGGANGNRLYSIPPWDSGHWTMGGRKEKNTWTVGVAGHCFSLVHQSESNRPWALFKSKMCRLFHETVAQVVVCHCGLWWHFHIHVTVLEFYGWKELHPIKGLDSHRLQRKKKQTKNTTCQYAEEVAVLYDSTQQC